MGVGIALIGRALDRPDLVALGPLAVCFMYGTTACSRACVPLR